MIYKKGTKINLLENGYIRGMGINKGKVDLKKSYSIEGFDGKHYYIIDDTDGMLYLDKEDFILVEEEDNLASSKQIAGNHYSKLKIQPMKYALDNNLNYAQSNAIKYITRYKDKNGIEDLKKAIHCIELLIQHEETGL